MASQGYYGGQQQQPQGGYVSDSIGARAGQGGDADVH